MMAASPYHALAERVLAGGRITRAEALDLLASPDEELLVQVDAAFQVRLAHFGRQVQLHVLSNAKLGACPEDCGFCSQSSKFGSPSGEAPIVTADELVAQGKVAAAGGAKRFCMVTATRGPSSRDLDVICEAATRLKTDHSIELCASLGFLTEAKAERLAKAGVDRFNHNLETSERHFGEVVTTHKWCDRLNTVKIAKQAGMTTCSGGIIGLGETDADVVDLAFALADLEVDSVPVNFLDPRPGTPLGESKRISPRYALKALCMFRMVHPRADLRVAGGREVVFRTMQPLAMYPANSLFTSGYLTTDGNEPSQDLQMLLDLGFEIDPAIADHGEARDRRALPLA